jgi:hypothetical protein
MRWESLYDKFLDVAPKKGFAIVSLKALKEAYYRQRARNRRKATTSS